MTEEQKPKKRKMDNLYTLIIAALYEMINQVPEIYDLGFDDVMSHIEQHEHGC